MLDGGLAHDLRNPAGTGQLSFVSRKSRNSCRRVNYGPIDGVLRTLRDFFLTKKPARILVAELRVLHLNPEVA
jgi:hypothetical protein